MNATIFSKARMMGTCFLWATLAVGGMFTACSDDDDLTTLTSPSGSEAVEATATSLTFTWNKVSGVNQYGLTLKDAEGNAVATDVTSATTAVFSGLTPGVTYTLEVTAYAGMDTGYANSKPLTLKGTTLSFIQLEAPAPIAAPAVRTVISWQPVDNATAYAYSYELYGETVSATITDTSVTIDFLPVDETVTVSVTALSPENELYTPSETTTVEVTRTREQVKSVKGVWDGHDNTVTCVSYSDGSYSLKGWYGVEGYDLDFYYDEENNWIVTDSYENGGWNWAATGVDANGMWFVTTYPNYSGFYGNMTKGGVWFYVWENNDYVLYSVSWPQALSESLADLLVGTYTGTTDGGDYFSADWSWEQVEGHAESVTITKQDDNTLILSNLFWEGSSLTVNVDEENNTLTIPASQDFYGYTFTLYNSKNSSLDVEIGFDLEAGTLTIPKDADWNTYNAWELAYDGYFYAWYITSLTKQ